MSSVSNIKAPPSLSKCSSYETWLKEIEIWQAFTDLAEIKQGPAIFLSLDGRAREAVLELEVVKISAKDGVKNIIAKLDSLYLKDKTQSAFESYDAFEKFKRPSEMSISEYINEFERLKAKTESFKTVLSTDVLAYRLLKSANLSENHEQLARATITDLTYETMKTQLKKIFGDSSRDHLPSSDLTNIKVEPVFEASAEDSYYGNNFRSNKYRYNQKGKQSQNKGNYPKQDTRRFSASSKKGRNPMNKRGEVSRCDICDSINHWASTCPDAVYYQQEQQNSSSDEENSHQVTLFQSSLVTDDQLKVFVSETLNTAVLDSGATANVAGKTWIDCYIGSLSDSDKTKVSYSESGSSFKFGSDTVFNSLYKVKMPASIGSHEIQVETDVIDTNVPLLLSKKAMKTANTKINFKDDTVVMFGEKQTVILTKSGHYSVPLDNKHKILHDASINSSKIILHISPQDLNSKTTIANKLHSQFAHPPSEKLVKLISAAGMGNDVSLIKAIKDVSKNCDICKVYKRPAAKPIVGMPLANDFNEVVAMDLKFFHGKIILHLIDHVSRFSAAAIIPSKQANEIISKIFKIWISVFGPPKRFLSDNGGEFVNGDFIEMCESFNIVVLTTAAESPWSNGLCERHNAVLGNMLEKVSAEQKCDLETALCWAIHAKNSLSNVHGFSPYQIAVGFTPKLPCVLDDSPPAMESPTNSLVLRNLNTMASARKAYIESESSERVKRALKHNLRTTNNHKYVSGDIVFYKRNDAKKWKGPAKVLGTDSQQVLLKHGGSYVRVHSCRVMLQKDSFEKGDIDQSVENLDKSSQHSSSVNIDSNEPSAILSSSSSDEESNEDEYHDVLERNEQESVIAATPTVSNSVNSASSKSKVDSQLKRGIDVEYLNPNNEWKRISLIGRAGKATGKYKSHWNVSDGEDVFEVDMENVEWKIPESDSLSQGDTSVCQSVDEINLNEAYVSEVDKATQDAKRNELENWKVEGVYEEVNDNGQETISVRWVVTPKLVNDTWTTKARLVARGFQENVDDLRTDSPTCMRETLRLVLSMANSMHWHINSIDIKAAFLQGKSIDRQLYLKPPKEANCEGKVWLLKKAVYGLSDASRVWYLRVVDELSKLGVKISSYDKALFTWKWEGKIQGLISVHVDDFIWCGSHDFQEKVIKTLKSVFKISKESKKAFRYLGIDLNQQQTFLLLGQNSYIDSLEPILLPKSLDKDADVDHDLRRSFKALVGQINWACGTSRPDSSFDGCVLSTSQSKPTYRNLIDANKALREMKNNKLQIKFPKLQLSSLKIAVYSDASYGNLNDGSSQGGYIVFICDKCGNCAPVSWASKKLKRVVRSTLAAETLAAIEALDSAYLVAKLLSEFLSEKNTREIDIFTDNKSLYDAVGTSNLVVEKRLRVDIAALREMLEKDNVNFKWVESSHQLADALTKKGASKRNLLDVLSSGHFEG